MKYITTVNSHEYEIEIDRDDRIIVNGQPYQVDFQQLAEGGILSLLLNNHSIEAIVEEREEAWEVLIFGELYTVNVQDERAYRLAKARGTAAPITGEAAITSPMPGLIIAVPVHEGQEVKKGDKVVILESMKMENELRAPRDGLVLRVNVQPGVSVEKDQVLAVVGDGVVE
ncbi:MAG: biotin/lipoyl-binding protein [Chloroflexi bacterium]|nr:biotin/lipoyl-binding protein [Chloroflexota bacterium]MCI0575241.1 biotin/lipoyl-binding protein [Chloroflexota bacterium]MCI0648838.1 biotin/lipoyl-binding protein [Chloroflexota bacterium]MCI0726593.1 biotin/lipoyl-binding protein [Chloroflexota bacterium]